MAEINDLNVNDASNTARFPEGQAPSTVNNGARALEGLIARWHKDENTSLVTAGTATAYTVTANRTLTYYDGLKIGVDFHVNSGASPTLNVNALGAKAIIWPDGTALATNEIVAGAKILLVYDGVSFQIQSPNVSPAAATGVQRQSYSFATDTGAANAYVVTLAPVPSSYTTGMRVSFRAANANTAASTINVNGLGTRNIFDHRTLAALGGGEIKANGIYNLEYDGTQFLLLNPAQTVITETFNANGTYTKHPAAVLIRVQAWGAGGSGAGGTNTNPGGGGGGGAYVEKLFLASEVGTSETVTRGTGGASKSGGANGDNGGNTTFGSLLTAFGGAGGFYSTTGTARPGGGGGGQHSAPSGQTGGRPRITTADGATNVNSTHGGGDGGNSGATGIAGGDSGVGGGGGGGASTTGSAPNNNTGGNSVWGGAGGGGAIGNATGAGSLGGTSTFAGNGGNGGFDATNGTNGATPGGGGGGSETGTSGTGGNGRVIVTTWISG